MSDFSVRSDNVDVEQIMGQIRARIREKRGVDYTEDEIRELAKVKLEKFIDPKGVRSGLLEEYRRVSTPEPPAPNFAFGEDTLYETHRGPIRWLRAIFRPFLKLLFNPNPLIQALHIQADLNQRNAERTARREQLDALHYEVIHNLVLELTRTGVEVKSLKMRLESMASRLDFDERRARALEGVVQYRAGAVPPQQPPAHQEQGRREQGGREQGGRDQRPHQGRGDQGRGDRGRGDQRPHDQSRRDQGQRSSNQPPPAPSSVPGASVPAAAASPGAGSVAPGTPLEANALDADGNERRARRRRRRGRRRPGDRFGEDAGREAGGASGDGGDASREAGGANRDGADASREAGGAPTPSQQPAERVSDPAPRAAHIAPSAFAEATADKRASNSEGVSGGASDSGAPPDRAE